MPYVLDTVIALTDLANAKEQCHIPAAETESDNIITRFINEASQRIENMTSRALKSRAHVDYFDGRRHNRQLSRSWPIISMDEVWIDYTSEFTDVANKLDATKYFIDELNTGVILKKCLFPRGNRNIKFVYTAGYAVIPADLEGACLWMVEYFYDRWSDESVGTQTKSKNSENVTFLQDVPDFVQAVLDKYTRFEFPLTQPVENV